MTEDHIKAAIAKAIYCHNGRLPAPWDADLLDNPDWQPYRLEAESQAAAVMALVGPKPLVWHDESGDSLVAGPYEIWHGNNGHELTYWQIVQGEAHPALEAAQAAAQAHADAAHWGRMVLADMIGGE